MYRHLGPLLRGIAAGLSFFALTGFDLGLGLGISNSQNGARALVDVSQRAPTVSDDSTLGFAVGSLWLFNGTVFQASSVSLGAAVWVAVSVPAQLPLDNVTGAAAAYSVNKLRAAYGGAAFNVTRASDSTSQDIGFVSNKLDTSTLFTFCASTTCSIGTWYDQSGNGLNATQATAANQPSIIQVNTVAGNTPVSFNSVPFTTGTLSAVAKFMSLPAGLSLNPRTTTAFFAGQTPNTATSSIFAILGAGTTKFIADSFCTSAASGAAFFNGISTAPFMPMPTQPSVATMFGNGAGTGASTAVVNNASAAGAVGNPGALTGGFLGSNINDNCGGPSNWDALAAIFYASNLSSANRQLMQASLYQMFNIVPQAEDAVVFDGDSSSMGRGSANDNTELRLSLPSINRTVNAFTVAQTGETIASRLTSFSNIYTKGLYSSTYRNFAIHLLIGPNDIRNGTGETTICGNIKTYVSQLFALGSNVKVYLATPFLQTDIAGVPSQLASENTLVSDILAGRCGAATGYSNIRNQPTIGAGIGNNTSALSSASLSPDGQHLTDLGQSSYAGVAGPLINTLFH